MKTMQKPVGFRTVFTGSAGIDVTTQPDTSFVTETGHFELLPSCHGSIARRTVPLFRTDPLRLDVENET